MSKGKGLIWLHKISDNECEVHPLIYTGSDETAKDDARELLSDASIWGERLKKMQVGEWIRFTVKWEVIYTKSWCPYYGAYEHDAFVGYDFVRTLRKGKYVQKYTAKACNYAWG
jgi:hypothetical protein